MPDGDRFYRRLSGTGRGWGTAYRLACINSSFTLLGDKALKAIADNFNRISPDSISKAIKILLYSFSEERWQKQGLSLTSADNYSKLDEALNLSRFQGDFDLVKLLEKSVRKSYLEYKDSCLSVSNREIIETLGQTLANEIMDSRFLSRARDGIMKEQNRTISEQREWEQQLFKEVSAFSRKLIKWDGIHIKKVRKPITRRIDRNATSNILNRSLTAF